MKIAIRTMFLATLFSCVVISASDSKSATAGAGDATPASVQPAELKGHTLFRAGEFRVKSGQLPQTSRDKEEDVRNAGSGKEAE